MNKNDSVLPTVNTRLINAKANEYPDASELTLLVCDALQQLLDGKAVEEVFVIYHTRRWWRASTKDMSVLGAGAVFSSGVTSLHFMLSTGQTDDFGNVLSGLLEALRSVTTNFLYGNTLNSLPEQPDAGTGLSPISTNGSITMVLCQKWQYMPSSIIDEE